MSKAQFDELVAAGHHGLGLSYTESVPAGVDWDAHGNDWTTTAQCDHPLDDAAREAIERANGGPVFGAPAPSSDGREALLRVIGMLSTGNGQQAAGTIANHISFRQSATETPADFIRRIALALLSEMAGVA